VQFLNSVESSQAQPVKLQKGDMFNANSNSQFPILNSTEDLLNQDSQRNELPLHTESGA
jgi:hypothetical protein